MDGGSENTAWEIFFFSFGFFFYFTFGREDVRRLAEDTLNKHPMIRHNNSHEIAAGATTRYSYARLGR